jgi:hypothetical protein
MTKLDKPLRREITIDGQPFVVTLSPEGFRLVGKGRRKGLEIQWEALVSGEVALATALKASITGDVPLAPSKGNAVERKPATKRTRQRSRPEKGS